MTRILHKGSRVCTIKLRTVRLVPFYIIASMFVMMIFVMAFTPMNSAIIKFPTTTLTDTNLEYNTYIQYSTNQNGLYRYNFGIHTQQRWNLTSSSELTVWNHLTSNASFGESTRNAQEFTFKINSSSSDLEVISGNRPYCLVGPWEHSWPSPDAAEFSINIQEVSLTYETARYMTIKYDSTTTISFSDGSIPVRLYKGSTTFTQGCG